MSSLAPIINWKPRHENIVVLHLNGWSNIAIADYMGITPVRVHQVLQDPQAQAVIRATMSRVRENLSAETADRLLELTEKAVERIAETLDMTFVPGTDPKKHQDNVSLQLLKGKGFLSDDRGEDGKVKERIPVSLLERFTEALEATNKAKMLNGVPEDAGSDGEIIDADVEIVED